MINTLTISEKMVYEYMNHFHSAYFTLNGPTILTCHSLKTIFSLVVFFFISTHEGIKIIL